MENGVETVQGSNSGENKATEERVLEESIAERVLGVFHISKGSEGDEVFEEATEQLQEQVVSPDTQDAAADEDGNVQVVHDSRVEADDGTFSVENEVETFEEATEQLQEQIVITDTQDGAVNEEGTARSVLDSLEEAGDGNHSVTKTENVDETMGVPAEIENHEQEMTSVVEVGMESLQDGECGDKNLAINGDNEGGTGRVAEMDELNGLVSSYAKMSNNDGNEETMEVYDSSEWRARVGELDSSDGGEISNHSSIEEAPVVNDMTEMEAVMDELNGLLSSGWKEEISNGGADEETVVMHDVAEKGADLYELNGLVSSGRKELYNESGNEETAGANDVAEKGVDISEFSGLVCNGGKEISNDGANEEMAVVNDVAGNGADMSEFSGLVSSGGKEISNDGANEEMVWVNGVATSEADIGTSNVLVSSGGKEISNDGANKETMVNNVAEKRADVDELDLLVDSGLRETCTDGTNEEALTVLDADKAIKESDTLIVLDADKAIKESDTCDDWVDGKIHEKSKNGYADKKVSKDVNSCLQDEVNEKILHHRDQGEDLKNENGDAEHQDEKTSSDEKDVQSGLYARHQDDNCKEIKCLADMDSGRGGNNGKEPNHVSGAENNKSSLPQHFEENICQVSRNHAIPEESEKKEIRHKEENQNIRGNRERETRPTNEAGSASRKSSNPAPLPAHPAGLGRAAPLLEPASRLVQQPRANGAVSQVQAQPADEPTNGETEENDETREKLQMIRVKFLRLAHRLGQTPHNVVVAQVLYRLGLAEQIRGRNRGRAGAFSFDRASAMAEQLEAAGQEPLDFACTLMVLGKTGVGKSATINSIFDEIKFGTDAFQFGTKKVQDVVGTVQGIKVRVIDTPGLLPSWSDQRQNVKILHSVKRFIKKTPPDIVLYLDRLDMQSRDFSDMPLLLTITDIFGPSIWFNAIVVLTHAASAPPDGPNGVASSYDMFVTQRSHVVQQVIRQAAGDMRLMNPVSLVENHSACRTNRAGQRVLPNGQVWKPHLLLLSFASKILAEANALLKLQDSPPGKPFVTRSRSPPLPFLLSSLLQSRPQLKLPEEQFGEDEALEDDLDELSDSDIESEYDELPPFRRLTKAQLAKLTKDQRKAYYDELEYREKLFMKKQLKEERKQRKQMKKMAASAKDIPAPGDYGENLEDESSSAASVPVPMPDLALPASFDSDNPTHRYRYLDTSNQWLVRPVLETHGWDHDVGYEGINVERLFMVKDSIPFSFSGQVTKDKKDANLQMEVASSIKHGEGKATSLGFDMQTVGKDMSYTLRSETGFSNRKHNKATAGLSVTLLGDALSAGLKLEDKLIVNKRFRVVMTGGAMAGRGDVAYGGSLEATLKDKDYPLGRSLSTLGLSVMDWHGDLAIGCNIQSQIPVGRHTNMIARANLNNRGAGQVSIRMHSSEQLQIALIALLPICRKIFGGYSPPLQFGQW